MKTIMKTTIIAALALAAIPVGMAGPSEEDQLLVLAEQTFLQLHRRYVTLPDMTSERLARSTDMLPPGWPAGSPKGIVESQYIDQAFLAIGLDGLGMGMIVDFDVNGLHVFVKFWRNPTDGVVYVEQAFVADPEDVVVVNNTTQGECTGATVTCNCVNYNNETDQCGGAMCDGESYQDNGQTTEEGHRLMENAAGETITICGDTRLVVIIANSQ